MKNGVNSVDLELKEFEEKINNITEQFMSLLDSNDDIGSSVGNKFSETSKAYSESLGGPTVFNTGVENFSTISSYTGSESGYAGIEPSKFKIGVGDVNFGGISYGNSNNTYNEVPKHAIRFDSAETYELNKKLEGLYNTKKDVTVDAYTGKPTMAFSDSNIGRINSTGISISYADTAATGSTTSSTYTTNSNNTKINSGYGAYTNNTNTTTTTTNNNYGTYANNNHTKEETYSTLNKKEVYEMASYNGENHISDTVYSFATIPADKALVEKRSFKDVLFMDIPWDTKIDIWGGIKKFCTAQVKITF